MQGLIIEGSHFKCKTTTKCLSIFKRVEMVDKSKDDSFPSPAILRIISVRDKIPQKKIKLLWNFCILNSFSFEVMLLTKEKTNRTIKYACCRLNDDIDDVDVDVDDCACK